MDRERWKKISRIFELALTLPEKRRTTYIEHLCAGDTELEKEINDLLASIEPSDQLLQDHLKNNEVLLKELSRHLEQGKEFRSLTGSVIGHWKIISLLGRGGMGDVYKVERTDSDILQQGALKILRRGLDTPDNIRRFRLEKQILAGLHHPNIASLIDGGISDDGLPYLVMEYVEGIPIDTFCDHHKLTIGERLNLFQTVCTAVQHAHKNLVVHRDLKPENILVTKDGRIKILDFGIAKLLDPDLYAFSTVETRQGLRLMSLEYAAPEQVSGEAITTATDQYSLGVLLYELLAGVHPFVFGDKTYRSAVQIIQEEEPPSPSQRLSRLSEPEQLSDIAECRSVRPSQLIKSLGGDLDAIVLKALRKEPDDRYTAAGQLNEDITLYHQDKPVHARKRALQYRLTKFLHRYRLGVTAAAIAVLSLLGGLGTALWQAHEAGLERDRAQLEARKAQEVTDFMLGLFEAGDPAEVQGDIPTARELLDRGIERAEALGAQPVVQAEMFGVIGRAYRNLALYEEADSLLTRSLRTFRRTYGEAHTEVAKTLRDLAILYQDIGHYREADSLYRMTLSQQRRLLGDEHLEVAETLSRMSRNRVLMSRDSSDIETAEAELREAMSIRRKKLGNRHPDIAKDLVRLSRIMYYKEDRPAQEDLLQQALEIQRDRLGGDHPDVADTKEKLGTAYYNSGRYEEAEILHREALEIRREIYGNDHPLVGISLNSLALTTSAQGEYDTAADFYEEALTIHRRAYGEKSPKLASILNNASNVYMKEGRYDKAEELQLRALQIHTNHYGADSPLTASSYYHLSLTNLKQGELDEAEVWARKSLKVDRELGNDLYTAWDLIQLALIEEERKNYVAAESLRKEGLVLQVGALQENHHHVADSYHGLARIYIKQGRYEEAEPLLRKAMVIKLEKLENDDPRTAKTKSLLGMCLTGLERYEEAEKTLTEAYETLETGDDNQREEQLKALRRLSALYDAWNRPAMAAAYRDTLAILE